MCVRDTFLSRESSVVLFVLLPFLSYKKTHTHPCYFCFVCSLFFWGGRGLDCGKMLMGEKKWTEAYQEFFSGFSRHSETANPRARECLKYVVLANMLSGSNINPFSTKEASAYKEAPVIAAMIQLRDGT